MYQESEKPPHHAVTVRGPPNGDSTVDPSTVDQQRSNPQEAAQASIDYPSGLLGRVSQFIHGAAPHPNADIALAGSIGFLAGVTGKAYNTYTGAGLNQYILLLANTAMGKEAIKGGIDKLLAAVSVSVPPANGFRGPALVSSAGLVKWLAEKPSIVSVIGEFGYKLKAFSSPRANPNDELLKATLLDLYGKSGAGSVLDPMAYSDREKRTGLIVSPSLTIIGESVPGVVYEALSEAMVVSGLLPRFLLIEAKGPRSSLNETPVSAPDCQLTQSLADLCTHCLTLNSHNRVQVVEAEPKAKAKFREFGAWVDAQINAHTSEAQRELWNRAHLKALKLATLHAIGVNPLSPMVTIGETMWATGFIVDQTNALAAKFANGEVGAVAGDQTKQEREVLRVIREYRTKAWADCSKYHGDEDMHRMGVITQAHIAQRLYSTKCFREDTRSGAKDALQRALKSLLDADMIREVPPAQMVSSYGKHPRAYVVSDPAAILKSDSG